MAVGDEGPQEALAAGVGGYGLQKEVFTKNNIKCSKCHRVRAGQGARGALLPALPGGLEG